MSILVLFFTSSLMAQATGAAPAAGGAGMFMNAILPFVVIFAIFYFLVIRPQQKQRNKHQDFISNLKKGDEVITSSGIIGTVHNVSDKIVTLEISDDVKVKVLKGMVSASAKQAVEENASKSN